MCVLQEKGNIKQHVHMSLNMRKVKPQVNSGSTINLTPRKYVQYIKLQQVTKEIQMWNGVEVAAFNN